MLKWNITERTPPEPTLVALEGNLDEGAEEALLELAARLRPGSYVFDSERIKRINSLGVSAWTTFIRRLPPTVEYRFERCASAFLEYSTIVPQMSGRGEIRSFYVHFACDGCRKETPDLVECDDIDEDLDELPTRPCESCGGTRRAMMPVDELLTSPGVERAVKAR